MENLKKVIKKGIGNSLPRYLAIRVAERIANYIHSENMEIIKKK